MQNTVKTAIAALMLTSAAAWAEGGNGFGSSASADASSGSRAQVGIQQDVDATTYLDNRTIYEPGALSRNGEKTTNRIEAAPDVVAPSLGSGHPCLVNTSIGLSIIGGGASGGSGKVDVGCMMLRTGNPEDRAAGRLYYALKDPVACEAWRAVGALPAAQPCTAAERRARRQASTATVSTRSAPAPVAIPASAGYDKCERNGNAVTIRYSKGSDKVAAKAACLASLGL